jgi:hypothetical protein
MVGERTSWGSQGDEGVQMKKIGSSRRSRVESRSTVTFIVAVRSNLTDTYVHLLTAWDYRAHSMLH